MRASPSYRVVVFDFDGTLADSVVWFSRVINGVARRYHFRQLSLAELDIIRGEAPTAMLRRFGVARWKLPFIARHMRGLMTRDIDQVVLFPGVDRLIEALSAGGTTIAVVSSNAEVNVRTVLGPDLAALVDHYACGSSLFGKAVKIARLVKQCDVPSSAVLAIGDEIRDIDAAEAAGVASGAVTWGYAHAGALRERGPTWLFDTVEEIAAAVFSTDVAADARMTMPASRPLFP